MAQRAQLTRPVGAPFPINLDFFKFSFFFASLKGRASPAMAGKSR
jgi:hypothetical protein